MRILGEFARARNRPILSKQCLSCARVCQITFSFPSTCYLCERNIISAVFFPSKWSCWNRDSFRTGLLLGWSIPVKKKQCTYFLDILSNAHNRQRQWFVKETLPGQKQKTFGLQRQIQENLLQVSRLEYRGVTKKENSPTPSLARSMQRVLYKFHRPCGMNLAKRGNSARVRESGVAERVTPFGVRTTWHRTLRNFSVDAVHDIDVSFPIAGQQSLFELPSHMCGTPTSCRKTFLDLCSGLPNHFQFPRNLSLEWT